MSNIKKLTVDKPVCYDMPTRQYMEKCTKMNKSDFYTPEGWINIDKPVCYDMPTRQCCLCYRIENLDATYVKREYSWICPKCVNALRKVIKNSLYGEMHENEQK